MKIYVPSTFIIVRLCQDYVEDIDREFGDLKKLSLTENYITILDKIHVLNFVMVTNSGRGKSKTGD